MRKSCYLSDVSEIYMKHFFSIFAGLLLASCGSALELQKFDAAGVRTSGDQQALAVDVKALTFREVKFLNSQPFDRSVLRPGATSNSNRASEQSVVAVNAPPVIKPEPYRIGEGDVLSLSLVGAKSVQPSRVNSLSGGALDLSMLNTTQAEPALLSSPSQVTSDGTVLFLETGKLKLSGLTLTEAEALISDALIRNNVDPLFQLSVTEFASQTVSLITPGINDSPGSAKLFPVTSRPISLRDLLSAGGVALDGDKLMIVELRRHGKTYSLPLERVFAAKAPDYYLLPQDVVVVEALAFAQSNAYLSVSTGAPVTFPLKSEERPTLADMLFVEGGPLSERTARLSEIYLLRGRNPITAYHLNAEDVTRLTVAREVELRPGDIVFVADKPVYSAVEFLSVLNPFRALAGGL